MSIQIWNISIAGRRERQTVRNGRVEWVEEGSTLPSIVAAELGH